MENSKNNTPVERASGAKSEPCNVPDKETRVRFYEHKEAQIREKILDVEDGFALIDETLRQMFDLVKRSRPEIEKENDPQSLVPHLLFLKALTYVIDQAQDFQRSELQSETEFAEKIKLLAATEIDPNIKDDLTKVFDRSMAKVASLTENLQEMEIRKQRRSEMLAPILAEINELIPNSVVKSLDEKD